MTRSDKPSRRLPLDRPGNTSYIPLAMFQYLRVDARGRSCPVPILELARAVRTAPLGALIELLATDLAVPDDLNAWCEATGHQLTSIETLPGPVFRAEVRKAR